MIWSFFFIDTVQFSKKMVKDKYLCLWQKQQFPPSGHCFQFMLSSAVNPTDEGDGLIEIADIKNIELKRLR